MIELPAMAAPVAGALVGFVIGYSVRRSRLCSFGAIEDAVIGHDWRRMKIFGLALAIAIALTQAMVLAGWLDTAKSSYVPLRLPWLSILVGSLLFGVGMSLVGTCAFGSLVRLGGGDLRSFVVILVFSVVAYAVLRGVFAPLRINLFEQVWISGAGGRQVSLPEIAAYFFGDVRWIVAMVPALVLGAIALADRRLLRAPRLLTAALTLGTGVAAGWFFTGVVVDAFAEPPPRMESLTFVAPTARAVLFIATAETHAFSFGVASVAGVIAGAFAHAFAAREFRWEAFDDHYEMRRHVAGAVCMGAGGILAGGCTIGQGLAAGSMLSLSWPLAVVGIIIGARVGLGFMIEGSLTGWLASRWPFGASQSRD